jgi:hypothetical protein
LIVSENVFTAAVVPPLEDDAAALLEADVAAPPDADVEELLDEPQPANSTGATRPKSAKRRTGPSGRHVRHFRLAIQSLSSNSV